MLIVEQNLDFALKVGDRCAVIMQGEVDDSGPVSLESRQSIMEHLKI